MCEAESIKTCIMPMIDNHDNQCQIRLYQFIIIEDDLLLGITQTESSVQKWLLCSVLREVFLALEYLSTVAIFLPLACKSTFQRGYLEPSTRVANWIKVLGSHAPHHHHHPCAAVIWRAVEFQRNWSLVDGSHCCNLAQAWMAKGFCRNSLVNKKSSSISWHAILTGTITFLSVCWN